MKSATQLGRSLHDLVILSLAGFPSSGRLLLSKYWDQIGLESIYPGLPTEGILTWPRLRETAGFSKQGDTETTAKA